MMRSRSSPNFPLIVILISADNLQAMVELIEPHAVKGIWPEEGQIWSCAMTLQCSRRDRAYAESMIRSPLGRRSSAEGWTGELFQIARRLGPPPGKYTVTARAMAQVQKTKSAGSYARPSMLQTELAEEACD